MQFLWSVYAFVHANNANNRLPTSNPTQSNGEGAAAATAAAKTIL